MKALENQLLYAAPNRCKYCDLLNIGDTPDFWISTTLRVSDRQLWMPIR
jgi:hypothetical protein